MTWLDDGRLLNVCVFVGSYRKRWPANRSTHHVTCPRPTFEVSDSTWDYAGGKHIAGFWALNKQARRNGQIGQLMVPDARPLDASFKGGGWKMWCFEGWLVECFQSHPGRSFSVQLKVMWTQWQTSGNAKCCAWNSVQWRASKHSAVKLKEELEAFRVAGPNDFGGDFWRS